MRARCHELHEGAEGRLPAEAGRRRHQGADGRVRRGPAVDEVAKARRRRDPGAIRPRGQVGDVEEVEEGAVLACGGRELGGERAQVAESRLEGRARVVRHQAGEALVARPTERPRADEGVEAGPEPVADVVEPGGGQEARAEVAREPRGPGEPGGLLRDAPDVRVAIRSEAGGGEIVRAGRLGRAPPEGGFGVHAGSVAAPVGWEERVPVAVVFGARNVGRAIVAERLAAGWRALAVSRSDDTLERLRAAHPEAETMAADAGDPDAVEAALLRAERDLGGIDLVVNAAAGGGRGGPFGGGPIAEAPDDRLQAWTAGFLPIAWNVLRLGGRALEARGSGTLIQVSGGSARRGMPGRGPWAAAQFASRALVQSLAQELRPKGVHVALLVVDGGIQTDRNPMPGRPAEASAHPDDVARAAAYLTDQSPRAWTHELVITPALDTWVP